MCVYVCVNVRAAHTCEGDACVGVVIVCGVAGVAGKKGFTQHWWMCVYLCLMYVCERGGAYTRARECYMSWCYCTFIY